MSPATGSGDPGAAAQDPQVISNPPGLPAISYRVDDFTGFRRALLRPLPREQAISDWRPPPGDLGLQVLEWWAYLADVLTFYNERYANESYLGTATQPGSIANLVALTGYQPAPGTAATGMVAAVSAAGQSAEPLAIPAGMSLSSSASPGVPSQTFEVDAEVTFTGPSTVPVALHPDTTLDQYPDTDGSPRSVLLAGRVSGVKVNDRLVLVGSGFSGTDDNWSLVTVQALRPATDPSTGTVNTSVTFVQGGWGPDSARVRPAASPPAASPPAASPPAASPPAGSAVSAPAVPAASGAPGPARNATGYRLLRPAATAAIMTPAALSAPGAPRRSQDPIVTSGLTPPTVLGVYLSAAVRAISAGDLVLFDRGAGHPAALAVVTETAEALLAIPFPGSTHHGEAAATRPPDILLTHTVLGLATADSSVVLAAKNHDVLGFIAVRYGFRDVGTIIGVPPPELHSLGGTVAAAYTPPAVGTAAFLQDVNGAGVQVTVLPADSGNVTIAAAGARPAPAPATVPLAVPLAVPLRLLLNLVRVSRGTTVTGEVLGSGNAAFTRQSFTLAKSPLTYLSSGAGPVSTLTVTVNAIGWQEVSSFYGQAASARVFVVTRSPDQSVTTVTFGDGINGARLPSGAGNVVARYRYGSGQASPPAGLLTTISQPQLNLASIQNPVPVIPGADPQAPGDVRTAATASVSTFGRAISAADYEEIASRAPGVNRAAASWTFDQAEQRMLVTVYIGGGQAAVEAANTALADAEDPNRRVVATAAHAIELSLSGRLAVAAGQPASAVVAAAKAAAADLFSPGSMGIGQPLYRSAIDAALMVPGVLAVHDLQVTGANQVLGEVLAPGAGAYFELRPPVLTAEAVGAGD